MHRKNRIKSVVHVIVLQTIITYVRAMEITTYSNFRQNLKTFMDMVFKSHSPLFVTRSNGEDMVLMSKADYESVQETLYLLSSSGNAERLAKGIQEFEQGKGVRRNLIE